MSTLTIETRPLPELLKLTPAELVESLTWTGDDNSQERAAIQALLEAHHGSDEYTSVLKETLVQHGYQNIMSTLLRAELHADLSTTLLRLPKARPRWNAPTVQVALYPGEDVVYLEYNPAFVAQLSADALRFALMHETMHILMHHLELHMADPELVADPLFKDVVAESVVNWWSYRILKAGQGFNYEGSPLGLVRFEDVFKEYQEVCTKNGLVPACTDIGQFFEWDRTTYHYLDSIREHLPPPPPSGCGMGECPTCGGSGQAPDANQSNQADQSEKADQSENTVGPGADDGSESSGSGASGAEGEQAAETSPCPDCGGAGHRMASADADAKDFLDSVLDAAAQKAETNKNLRDQLSEFLDAFPELAQNWGTVGLGHLRGETDKGRAHAWWSYLMRGALASRVSEEEDRPAYNRKTGHFPTASPALGHPLSPVGRGDEKLAVIAVDTSGSMPQEILDRVAAMVGQIPNCEARWVYWDTSASEFDPGDTMKGGGGTTTTAVLDWLQEEMPNDFPDVVIMVTDALVGPDSTQAKYPYPQRWIWLVTEGGDASWIVGRQMVAIEVDDLSAVTGPSARRASRARV